MTTTLDLPVAGEAIASFADLRLSNATLGALAQMEIVTPTPIQAAALPALLDGHDVIGQARTGSGKTLAFGIPAVELVDTRQRGVQVLVLTPTRELATQVGGVLEQVGKPRGVRVGLIYGGRAFGPQRDMLRKGIPVIVGTPGRVLDLLDQGALWLDKVRFLVLDEADEMLDQGFAPAVERILARTTSARQTALFSATLPEWVQKTANKHLVDPVSVAVDPNPEDAAPIEHVAYDLPDGDKMRALKDLLDHRGEGSIIVFGRTKHGVKKLAKQLDIAGYPVGALQGNLSQNARDKVMEDFRSGKVPILLATNVAARGLDVTHIEQVINVELPESPELLTHRIGRTGRMGRQGQAITLLGHEDGAKWRQLERGLGRRIPRVRWQGAEAAIAGLSDEETAAAIAADAAPPRSNGRSGSQPASRSTSGRASGQRGAQAPAAGRGGEQGARNGAGRSADAQTTRIAGDRARPASPAPRYDRNDGDRSYAERSFEDRPYAERSLRGRAVGEPISTIVVDPGDLGDNAPVRQARTLYTVTCASCGNPAEVPFQPDPTRPVYCRDCFKASRGRGGRRELARA